jgi:hypothetical protein
MGSSLYGSRLSVRGSDIGGRLWRLSELEAPVCVRAVPADGDSALVA